MNLKAYPGSRWWRFDFHNHTPKSSDYSKAEISSLQPRDWLLAYMRAGIDCVAITDHNSSDWMEELQTVLEALDLEDNKPDGYRKLTLFPGVEITTSENLHILALFGPQTLKAKLDGLLHGKLHKSNPDKDNHEQMFDESAITVIDAIHELGGVAIAAHVDKKNGLFYGGRNEEDCFKPTMSQRSIEAILGKGKLDALEVKDTQGDAYQHCQLRRDIKHLACIIGSDAHTTAKVAAHFTWVKMSAPDFDGLKLALLDPESAIRLNDQVQGDPQPLPHQWIRSVTLENLHLRRDPLVLRFNPAYNAIIGGRGSGKSTVLECVRLALGRDYELQKLGSESEILNAFESFRQKHGRRDQPGMMLPDSKITVELIRGQGEHAELLQYGWRSSADDQSTICVRRWDEDGQNWQETGLDVEHARAAFPIKIFSQKQILAIANNPQALLEYIDDSIREQKEIWQQEFGKQKAALLEARYRVRTLKAELAKKPALELECKEASRKALVFRNSNFGPLLKAYQHATRQKRALEDFQRLLAEDIAHLRSGIEQAAHLPETELTDFEPQTAAEQEARDAALALKAQLVKQYGVIAQAIATMEQSLENATTARTESTWYKENQTHIENYRKESERLKAEGIHSAQEASIAVATEEQLRKQLEQLKGYETQLEQAEQTADHAGTSLYECREKLTKIRKKFVDELFAQNAMLKVTLRSMADAQGAVGSFRDILRLSDNAQHKEIWQKDETDENPSGILWDATDPDVAASVGERLQSMRLDLESGSKQVLRTTLHGSLIKRLKALPPEAFDELAWWFPEDEVRLEYRPSADSGYKSIQQASAGQKTAAMLSFLLVHGEEPLLLDQPEDDLDNALVSQLVVAQLRKNKARRQLVIVTHNANIVVNGDAELVLTMGFSGGQINLASSGGLQEQRIRKDICRVMEGGEEAFRQRYKRILKDLEGKS